MPSFEELFLTNQMGMHGHEIRRRRHAANRLRLLHDRGWRNPCRGQENPMSGQMAQDARGMLDIIEQALGADVWALVVWVVIAKGDINTCAEMFVGKECKPVEWLCHGLDKIAPMIGIREVI